MKSIWSPRLHLKRSRLARWVMARPVITAFREVLRAEIQSTPDLFNFNRHDPLADMYRSERRASAVNAGSGLIASGLSAVFPQAVVALPVLNYLGYKVGRGFRPAALVVGSALGLAGGLAYNQYRQAHEQPAKPPTIMPERPHAPVHERNGQIVMLARAQQARHAPVA